MGSKFDYLFFDMYSKRASFFYNNQEKIGSNLGLFLSIIYILILLILFIYYIILLLERKEIKVYDSTIYAQEIPSINVDSNNLYFAFGLEDPITNNRFIDESIYYPQILYIDRIKINGEFITIKKEILDFEICKKENFGEIYQHFFIKDELKNSYCLKNFNYSLILSGGFKYEKMSYIRIKIFPCKNSTENNNHCKSQEEIDFFLTNGYFSILIKDFGLNPSNYSFPVIPTLQDLFITVDKRLYTNLIINFGVTEVQTDKGIINRDFDTKNYLQFRKDIQTFSFLDEEEYLKGKEICIVQIRLDDTIFIQKRTYIKLSEIFSRIGGYMQLLYTIFSLICFLINKFNIELKIINNIFNFDLKNNKMSLKFQKLKDFDSSEILSNKKNLIFSSRLTLNNIKESNFENKNKNNLILKDYSNTPSFLNNSCNKKMNDTQSIQIDINKNKIIFNNDNKKQKININKKFNLFKNKENYNKIKYMNFPKEDLDLNILEDNILKDFNDNIKLNLFDFFCNRKNPKKKNDFKSFNLGISFYKRKMDLIHFFTVLLITEKILLKSHG